MQSTLVAVVESVESSWILLLRLLLRLPPLLPRLPQAVSEESWRQRAAHSCFRALASCRLLNLLSLRPQLPQLLVEEVAWARRVA
jgi:hypothetical protein